MGLKNPFDASQDFDRIRQVFEHVQHDDCVHRVWLASIALYHLILRLIMLRRHTVLASPDPLC